MMRLLFIRHGATAGNLERRYIGHTDEPLCEIGVRQIEDLKRQNLQADRLYVSPMRRTLQTAQILFPDMDYTVVDDFRETDFGIFEGKTAGELSDNSDYQSWLASWCRDAIPMGESVDAFKKRCCAAFRQLMESAKNDETIAFVVHGGTIMTIFEAYAQPHRDFYDYHVGNGQYFCCVYENGIVHISC